jgi:two-component system sensor histidine kinase KdpD
LDGKGLRGVHAPWVAVYVDKMGKDNEAEVLEDLDLAKRLGADTVRLNGHDEAAILAEYAKISGISNIVIGKIRNAKSFRLFDDDLDDKLISMLPGVEIHIIPESPQTRYRKRRKIKITENLIFSWADTWKSIGLLAAATLLSMGLRAVGIGDQNVIMLYILCVLVYQGHADTYTDGVVDPERILFNYFFIVPYLTFMRSSRDIP